MAGSSKRGEFKNLRLEFKKFVQNSTIWQENSRIDDGNQEIPCRIQELNLFIQKSQSASGHSPMAEFLR